VANSWLSWETPEATVRNPIQGTIRMFEYSKAPEQYCTVFCNPPNQRRQKYTRFSRSLQPTSLPVPLVHSRRGRFPPVIISTSFTFTSPQSRGASVEGVSFFFLLSFPFFSSRAGSCNHSTIHGLTPSIWSPAFLLHIFQPTVCSDCFIYPLSFAIAIRFLHGPERLILVLV
jgi:hypothetical protein